MSLIASRNAANSFIGEDFNETRQDPTSFFSEELVLEIFSTSISLHLVPYVVLAKNGNG